MVISMNWADGNAWSHLSDLMRRETDRVTRPRLAINGREEGKGIKAASNACHGPRPLRPVGGYSMAFGSRGVGSIGI
jgi:hypothetical protein